MKIGTDREDYFPTLEYLNHRERKVRRRKKKMAEKSRRRRNR